MKKISFILILLIVLVNCPNISLSISKNPDKKLSINNVISIGGNENFLQIANKETWNGQGTLESPIILSNLANLLPLTLDIQNTTLFFEIINNNIKYNTILLEVFFENVSNGLIHKNIFTGNSSPPTNDTNYYYNSFINLDNCSNIQISNNEFNFDVINSIYLSKSTNVIISNNKIINQYNGIKSTNNPSNKNITFENNFVNTEKGIQLHAESGYIKNNTFQNGGLLDTINYYYSTKNVYYSNNTLNGKPILMVINQSNIILNHNFGELIVILFSNNITLTDFNVRSEKFDLDVFISNNIIIENSRFMKVSGGISLYKTNNSFVRFNEFSNTSFTWSHSQDNVIENNTINSLSYGMDFYMGNNFQILTNNIYSNNGNGLSLLGLNNSLILANRIYNNTNVGIQLSWSSFNQLKGNNMYANQEGLAVTYNSYNNLITSNDIYDNRENGIAIGENNNSITSNAIHDNQGNGIYIVAGYNLIASNVIYNNQGNGIELFANNNLITSNVIYNNQGNGINILASSHGNSITNNTIYNNKGSGIYFQDTTLKNLNTIKNNDQFANGGKHFNLDISIISFIIIIMALIVVFLFIYRPKIKSLSLGSIEKVILSFKTSSRYDFGVCVKCGKKIEEKDTI